MHCQRFHLSALAAMAPVVCVILCGCRTTDSPQASLAGANDGTRLVPPAVTRYSLASEAKGATLVAPASPALVNSPAPAASAGVLPVSFQQPINNAGDAATGNRPYLVDDPAQRNAPAAAPVIRRAAARGGKAAEDGETGMAEILPPPEPFPSHAYPVNMPHTIDFTTALSLVAGQNPQVGFAQERINEAFAQLAEAKALWLPSLRAGVNYNKHEGRLQAVDGPVSQISKTALYSGFGANAVGAGSPTIPGLWAQFRLADAIFQPMIAERTVAARKHAATAATNDQLLQAALAYLELLRALQQRMIALQTQEHTQRLLELTTVFAQSGAGARADADRAQAELAVRNNDVIRAQEAVEVASARLAEVLALDPTLQFQPMEPTITPIDLVKLECPVQELVATGLTNRPELAESRMLVSEAVQRLKRERYAVWTPSLLLGVSDGGFGGSGGGYISNFGNRFDLNAVAYWQVRNLGFGEQAKRAEAHSRLHQAQLREVQRLDRVAREVAEAFSQARSRRRQIEIAESGITAASASYDRNLSRVRDGEGLPIELLQSIQALDQAQREYLRSVSDYNEAQFRLQRAIGWPIAP